MLQANFTQLIEQVQHLSRDEKQQLQCWLENDLREARRDEIYAAYQESQSKLSEQLLELAKRAVEIAIEQDEFTALEHLYNKEILQ